jgi:hypothetical protein
MSQEIPDFIIIGAMKSGTTSLYRHLGSHPGVFMSPVKEPNYFVPRRSWSKGPDWYRSLFAGAPPGALLGEASTNYSKGTTFPGVPEILRTHVPNVKLIYVLRDPLERIRSHYAHAVDHRREQRPPEAAIKPRSGYVRTSLYGAELQRYREHFPADQMLVLLTEDLRDDPASLLRRVEVFLGLEAYQYRHLDRHYHVTSKRRVSTRLGSALEQHERMQDLSTWVIPERLRDRLMSRPAPSTGVTVPPEALDQIRDVLAADRKLLQRQVDLDLSKWANLDVSSAARSGSQNPR